MTLPPTQNTRPLTRRQRLLPADWTPSIAPETTYKRITRRIRLLPVEWIPARYDIALNSKPDDPIQIETEQEEIIALPLPVRFRRKPRSKEDRNKEFAERRARVAKIIKVPLEVWQQQIQEDEDRLREGIYVPPVTHRIVPTKIKPTRKKRAPLPVFARKRNNRRPLYPDYSQFYGPIWKEVQAAAMARSKGKCEVCKRRKARHVHHILPFRYFINSEDAHFFRKYFGGLRPLSSGRTQENQA